MDAHHHLYPSNHWADDHGSYLIEEFSADLRAGHNVVATIYVECGQHYRTSGPEHLRSAGEAEFAASVARAAQSGAYGPACICDRFVGRADFMAGERVEEVIEELALASDGRLCGLRSPANWDADPLINSGSRAFAQQGLMAEPSFREALTRVSRHGLAFDAWQFYPQLGELADLARACPDAVIIAGHCGGLIGKGRYAGGDNFTRWKARVAELAECSNVFMKLGGLANDRTGFGFQQRQGNIAEDELVATWSPYILSCIEVFGPDRCMFESNFPVDMCATDYRTLWTVFKKIVAGASDDEKRALFAGTALRAYNFE
ncbi:amidohydrolase family protein [Novosphingobium album (ex Liu et al. 2023)]|uniref:Amidohydrolase family protein n=1 Tax=Novosphingobium album (ex Liu et al. 2023) TaxID=3031130 RepID=A0ABT5WQV9_9SPHN|nr:amidohydrolase family protein [Novosphingobium album (ex Liu et al. 2023)]MDE8652432.1 amidohydrolase family protein [Novosphingobium album (ex Liu et al. 2023)]